MSGVKIELNKVDILTKTLKLLENHSIAQISRKLRISHEQIHNKTRGIPTCVGQSQVSPIVAA